MNHECPRPGCTASVPHSQLACSRDWYLVPQAVRNRVWQAYKGPGPGSPEHTEAITDAIEHLEGLGPR